jgi:hypothetical protein
MTRAPNFYARRPKSQLPIDEQFQKQCEVLSFGSGTNERIESR